MSEIAIFEGASGEIQVQLGQETVWLSLDQMTQLFGRDKSTISRHVSNVFKEGELDRKSVVAKNATTATDGKTYQVDHFNLDVIISVGYRVKSQQGTRFRQWATKLINQHLTQGYTLNQQRFEQNAQELEAALILIRKAAASPDLIVDTGRGLVEIVSRYTQTFLWLQRYDEGLLNEPQGQPGGTLPSLQQAREALAHLKYNLMEKGEATELFAKPRGDGLEALLGNLDQSVFGEAAYPSIQSKAAHLLYFVVKNHPFTDGNKRSGAFLFVDFLHRNNHLINKQGQAIINDTGLAALTLLVAESNPKQKETLIRLIMNMLTPEENK
ncbi:MAG: virulence protein RhuM/Fic/DOC family protein [Hahellaceae bacterium]|nr:virulence protein RhuM/Fic/DOC family protein [Hahellaceae bacterium]MCP5211701.1 virulence protein RhuM/Fic/DOC family protein [Hahellaceae bacterium]